MKKRIDALQQNDSTIQNLQGEIERLKKELDSRKESALPRRKARPLTPSSAPDLAEHARFPIRAKSCFFPGPKPIARRFSFPRCGLMTSCAKAHALGTTQILSLLQPLFPSRAYLALTTNKTP